ncbi:GH15592 [Drosophila grimshawi]|uniref:GH15592 n=1 Tax=Drosophila grimshawi TaxID=7222 RepID=B4J0V1_DROGR|nr:GH15592 [Drosophila grimshawi]
MDTQARLQHQRATHSSAIRSHLIKVSTTLRHPIAFNFRRRECKRFYVLPVYMHSTKENSRLWWQYAFKCVARNAGNAVWNPNLKFKLHCKRQLRIRQLRRGTQWCNRQPLHLHIADIQLVCHVRRYSK